MTRERYVVGALRALERDLRASFLARDWDGVAILRRVAVAIEDVAAFLGEAECES